MANDTDGKYVDYSIPRETQNVFENGILQNPLIASTLPKEVEECSKSIRFEGTDKPSVPINWRFAESISALKGLEAAMVNVLLKQKNCRISIPKTSKPVRQTRTNKPALSASRPRNSRPPHTQKRTRTSVSSSCTPTRIPPRKRAGGRRHSTHPSPARSQA